MTKFMLTGAAALALLTGMVCTAAAQTVPDRDATPARYARQNEHYAYMAGPRGAVPDYTNTPARRPSYWPGITGPDTNFAGPVPITSGGNG